MPAIEQEPPASYPACTIHRHNVRERSGFWILPWRPSLTISRLPYTSSADKVSSRKCPCNSCYPVEDHSIFVKVFPPSQDFHFSQTGNKHSYSKRRYCPR